MRRINQIGSVEAGGRVEKKEKERRFLFTCYASGRVRRKEGKEVSEVYILEAAVIQAPLYE